MAIRTGPKSRFRTNRRRPRRQQQNRWLLLAAAVVAGAVLSWAALRLADGDDDSPAGLGADDPGVAHVHGLGVNPSDGSLYVATHFGTFQIEGDEPAERVGGVFQDTMGFTVAGPDHFLGSGHPDLEGIGEGSPTRLGLIESTDAGLSWERVSLNGEVDFHGLASAHGRVYGWDSTSGRFMVSPDKRTWSTRSTQSLLGFAVDPADPDHIVGAAPNGLVDSTDGGRTWTGRSGPSMVALSWDEEAGLLGATDDGTVHRSTDGGDTWSEGGRLPGSAHALLATPGALYAAAEDDDGTTGIHRSTDNGSTWRLRYRDTA